MGTVTPPPPPPPSPNPFWGCLGPKGGPKGLTKSPVQQLQVNGLLFVNHAVVCNLFTFSSER